MKIHTSTNVPNSTYFTASDVEPIINDDGSITIYNGKGTSRSWGTPQVTSTVVLDDCDFVAVHVGFSHKHRGGQAWYYYTTDGATTSRIKWQQLSDELRQRVLDNVKNAPAWAKSPGVLRSERVKSVAFTRTAYKLVEVRDDKLISLYDGCTEYKLNKRLCQPVGALARMEMARLGKAESHNGGYYSHQTPEQVMALWRSGNLVPDRCATPKCLALLECEISGTVVVFDNDKLCSTYIKPTRIVSTFEYQPG